MSRINDRHGGKREGAGRKSKAEEVGLQALLDKCWTEADREACITKLAKDAMSRHFNERQEARKLLMAYTFGRPVDKKEVTGEDGKDIVLRVVYETK